MLVFEGAKVQKFLFAQRKMRNFKKRHQCHQFLRLSFCYDTTVVEGETWSKKLSILNYSLIIANRANFSISIFTPAWSNWTEAFLFAPAPSMLRTVPAPNLACITRIPSCKRSGLEGSKSCGMGVSLAIIGQLRATIITITFWF